MKKTHTIFKLIFSIFVTILTVFLFVFFLKIIKNKDQHISVVLTTLQKKIGEKENAAKFAEKVTEIKSLQDSVNSLFVDPNKIDTFVDYLEEIGSNLGSKVIVQGIEMPPKTKNIIAIKISITGTFQEVMRTVSFVENIPYQVNITQVYLNKDIKQIRGGDVIEVTGNKEVKQPKVLEVSKWQADVSFNILSLN
ncbi:MAG: hypothetical protein WCT42_02630 [Candidatus Paceibacterota bacterium]|jgi:hypothetical protein